MHRRRRRYSWWWWWWQIDEDDREFIDWQHRGCLFRDLWPRTKWPRGHWIRQNFQELYPFSGPTVPFLNSKLLYTSFAIVCLHFATVSGQVLVTMWSGGQWSPFSLSRQHRRLVSYGSAACWKLSFTLIRADSWPPQPKTVVYSRGLIVETNGKFCVLLLIL